MHQTKVIFLTLLIGPVKKAPLFRIKAVLLGQVIGFQPALDEFLSSIDSFLKAAISVVTSIDSLFAHVSQVLFWDEHIINNICSLIFNYILKR